MIEDLDGGDIGRSRRAHMRVVSIVLAVGALVGYAAASSTAFQGPFAQPQPSPSPTAVVRFTPAPFLSVDTSIWVPSAGCVASGSVYNATEFGGQTVIISRPLTPLSTTSSCMVFWSHLPDPLPFDRFAR